MLQPNFEVDNESANQLLDSLDFGIYMATQRLTEKSTDKVYKTVSDIVKAKEITDEFNKNILMLCQLYLASNLSSEFNGFYSILQDLAYLFGFDKGSFFKAKPHQDFIRHLRRKIYALEAAQDYNYWQLLA